MIDCCLPGMGVTVRELTFLILRVELACRNSGRFERKADDKTRYTMWRDRQPYNLLEYMNSKYILFCLDGITY